MELEKLCNVEDAKLEAFENFMICCEVEKSTKTKSGLFLPEEQKDEFNPDGMPARILSVLEVGKEVKNILKGDIILCGNAPGHIFNLNGKKYRIVRQEETIAKLVNSKSEETENG